MLDDLIAHVDLLLVVAIVLIVYQMLGSPLRGLVKRS